MGTFRTFLVPHSWHTAEAEGMPSKKSEKLLSRKIIIAFSSSSGSFHLRRRRRRRRGRPKTDRAPKRRRNRERDLFWGKIKHGSSRKRDYFPLSPPPRCRHKNLEKRFFFLGFFGCLSCPFGLHTVLFIHFARGGIMRSTAEYINHL